MDSSATDRIYFNTDLLPERDRFPAFCGGMKCRNRRIADIAVQSVVADLPQLNRAFRRYGAAPSLLRAPAASS
jgi:hypothetical protein